MMERSRQSSYYSDWQATAVTPEEYRLLYSKTANKVKVKRKWRFRPRSIWPFLSWGFIIFITCRLLLFPLAEGIYNYFSKTFEVNDLKNQYQAMEKQLNVMEKNLAYMKTDSYVEERSHEMGYVKPNEAQMVMVEPSNDGQKYQPKQKKRVEIGD